MLETDGFNLQELENNMSDNIFVSLPENFIACPRHPGYFFNIQDRRLYSFKSGWLTPMKHNPANHWNKYNSGYRVSVEGVRRFISDEYLQKLSKMKSIIPVKVANDKN